MAEHNNHSNNTYPNINVNNFWLTHPPPPIIPSQSMTPVYNMDYSIPFVHPHMSTCNIPTPRNSITMPSCTSNLNFQDQYIPYNQPTSNSFPPLPDNIDEEYILKYLCPINFFTKDETNVWIKNWFANKGNESAVINKKSTNVKVKIISNQVKKCKILLENMNSKKQLIKQNVSSMTETEWEKACSDLFSIKEQLDISINTLKLDDNSMSELQFKLSKRKKKRNRLKRLKSDLKIVKSQQRNEIIKVNKEIDTWQNTIKENILKEIRTNETKMEANIVLKGVRGKIDDAKNHLSLFDTLDKLRKCRLQNCVNKRKNPLLEESLYKLKELWQQKLTEYNNEEEELKNMLSKSEAVKHEKREIKIQQKLEDWDQILFGPNFRSQENQFDNLHTFLDSRRDWDKYVINENETPANSSSIPVGWIIPSVPCNSDWAKYSINVNSL